MTLPDLALFAAIALPWAYGVFAIVHGLTIRHRP